MMISSIESGAADSADTAVIRKKNDGVLCIIEQKQFALAPARTARAQIEHFSERKLNPQSDARAARPQRKARAGAARLTQ